MMSYLSNTELQNWGDMSGLLTSPIDRTEKVFGAFFWTDWDRFRTQLLYDALPISKTHQQRLKIVKSARHEAE